MMRRGHVMRHAANVLSYLMVLLMAEEPVLTLLVPLLERESPRMNDQQSVARSRKPLLVDRQPTL